MSERDQGARDALAHLEDVRLVFDGSPGEGPMFVEAEVNGGSFRVGEWHEREDGLWELDLSGLLPTPGKDGAR